jgi:hypothetical protein
LVSSMVFLAWLVELSEQCVALSKFQSPELICAVVNVFF